MSEGSTHEKTRALMKIRDGLLALAAELRAAGNEEAALVAERLVKKADRVLRIEDR